MDAYDGLAFSFAAVEAEVRNVAKAAQPFLTRTSVEVVLPRWINALLSIRNAGKPARWEIEEVHPIETIPSKGQCEARKSAKKEPHLVGHLSVVWDINPSDDRKTFILLGIASTKVTIWRRDKKGQCHTAAQWKFEIGDQQSPGCHFHVGIGQDGGYALPVPRLPSYLLSPIDGLDFLLGELFQEGWSMRLAKETDEVIMYSKHQRERLLFVLDWVREQVYTSRTAPLNSLKARKPHAATLPLQRARS